MTQNYHIVPRSMRLGESSLTIMFTFYKTGNGAGVIRQFEYHDGLNKLGKKTDIGHIFRLI